MLAHGVSPRLIRRWVARRAIPFIRLARRVVFARSDVEAFEWRHRVEARTRTQIRQRWNLIMARKRPTSAPDPQPEQLVFPFQLRVGDVVLEEGAPAEVVGRPTNASDGKTTRASLLREGETVQREAVWEAWRKVRVVRRAA